MVQPPNLFVIANPRNEPGIVTESSNFRNSLSTQKKLMYQKGDIGVIPQEIRDRLVGRKFDSFDDFRKAFWEEIGNSKYAKEFSRGNQGLMKKGFAPRTGKNGRYKSLDTYVLHHKQPIEKGGGVYELDNLIIVSPKVHQTILDRAYHFGKKGASFKNIYRR
ncbi:colicin [Brevibacillus laterosporus]|nr:colicin [Brevibacillus laterosporus]